VSSREPRASGYFRSSYDQGLRLIETRTQWTSLALFLAALVCAIMGW